MPKVRKPRAQKPPPLIRIPAPNPDVAGWIVIGIDPSLSRTGYALMVVGHDQADWRDIGSLQPGDVSAPVWVRSKSLALALRNKIDSLFAQSEKPFGLIVALEAPTPRNDFLTSLSRTLHVILFEPRPDCPSNLRCTHVLMVYPATLRTFMGLKETGAKNKRENIRRAYEFIDPSEFPNLDSDACDAVLLCVLGRYAAALLLGNEQHVPEAQLLSLCNAKEQSKGKGPRKKVMTKGLLHRPETWWQYLPRRYEVLVRNARHRERRLERLLFTI